MGYDDDVGAAIVPYSFMRAPVAEVQDMGFRVLGLRIAALLLLTYACPHP